MPAMFIPMKHLCIIISLLFFIPLFAQESDTETYWLGKTAVKINVSKYGTAGTDILFLNLHENETTSITVVKEYLTDKNGVFVSVKQNGKRNLEFYLKKTKYKFDPNRMFTKDGRIANLKLLNKKYSSKAEEKVEEFSDKIIRRVKDAKLVIALHNNTNGKPLSVNSYEKKYVNPEMDTDDFVLTTDDEIFKQLKEKKINTVLETTSTSKDDGSLAYFCSKKGIAYINVEAQLGHSSEQMRMLNALTDIIANYSK